MLHLKSSFILMILLVTASNILVEYPINDWLTWGALSYPLSFLVTEVTNLRHGPKKTRGVVYAGFACAVLLSLIIATPRIAIASGSAFLISQLLDIYIFNRLRQRTWWQAPLCASIIASVIDSAIFWNIAFFGENVPLLKLACGDTAIKILIDIAMLTPFRIAFRRRRALESALT